MLVNVNGPQTLSNGCYLRENGTLVLQSWLGKNNSKFATKLKLGGLGKIASYYTMSICTVGLQEITDSEVQ